MVLYGHNPTYSTSGVSRGGDGIARKVSNRYCQRLKVAAIAMLCAGCDVGLARASQTIAQMYHKSWTVAEGAPLNIQTFAQTRDGFLWVATENGLFRFDGLAFERYQPSAGDPFPGPQVTALKATADGGLWIGYGRVGISYLKDGRNTNYGEQAGVGRTTFYQFEVEGHNAVWALGPYLLRFDGAKWKIIDKDWGYPVNVPPRSAFIDSRGTLWVGTSTGLFYLRRGEHTFRSVNNVTWRVNQVAESSNGTLWLSSSEAPLRALDPVTALLREDIPPVEIPTQGIYFARDASLWMEIPHHGLARIKNFQVMPSVGSTAQMQTFAAQDGLSNNDVGNLLEDREGSIWVTTARGIDQFRPTAFTVLPLPGDVARAQAAAAGPGQVFIGPSIVEVATGRVLAPRPASVSDDIATIYRDPDNSLWFGGTPGLWNFVDHHFVANTLPYHLPDGARVQAIAKDRRGDIWVSIARDGVYRRTGDTWTRVTQLEAAVDNLCLSIMIDSSGRIWFTYAQENQVQVLDGDTLRTFGIQDGLDIGYTTTVSQIAGNIIVGGETGMEILQDGRFRRLRLADGAAMAAVTGVLQQRNGDLWINQASGVLHISAADTARALSEPNFSIPFRLYDHLDGLDQITAPPSPLQTIVDSGDSKLYVVMRTNVYVVDTAHLPHNPQRPTVVIQALSGDKTEYLSPVQVALPENTDRVTIRFTGSSLLIPQRVQFRFRLDEIDKEWQSDSGQRLAVYSRLPPGHYTFRVIASNNDGVWNEEGASVKFSIPPSFVQSAGFKVLYGVLSMALLWLIYRIRLQQMTVQVRRRLYERLDERTRIARDLHDTFFQGIQGLLLRFNTAKGLLRSDDPARAIMEEALRKSDQVMLEGRELMLDLREGVSKTSDLAGALSSIGSDLRKDHPADFQLTVIGDPRPLHPVVFDEIHRFAREALGNAFRHARAKVIEAELHYGRRQLRVRVRDDGVGIDSEVLGRGFKAGHWGLPGMRERAKNLGGRVEIWSRANAGAEIELCVPAAASYARHAKQTPLTWLRDIIGVSKNQHSSDDDDLPTRRGDGRWGGA